MTYKKGDKKYSRLNQLTWNYVNAVNHGAEPEELHSRLRALLAEAITREITLGHLLRVFSSSSIEESDTEKFIEHVSRHYGYGVDAAQVQADGIQDRKERAEKAKKTQY